MSATEESAWFSQIRWASKVYEHHLTHDSAVAMELMLSTVQELVHTLFLFRPFYAAVFTNTLNNGD